MVFFQLLALRFWLLREWFLVLKSREATNKGEMQSHWEVTEGGARGSEGMRGAKLVDVHVRQRFENIGLY